MSLSKEEAILELLQEEFEKVLMEKTNWGRNDIKIRFEQTKVKALLRYIAAGPQ